MSIFWLVDIITTINRTKGKRRQIKINLLKVFLFYTNEGGEKICKKFECDICERESRS